MKITSGMITAFVLAASLAGGIVAGAIIADANIREPQLAPTAAPPTTPHQIRDLGSAKRTDGIAGCFVEGEPVAIECLEHAPRCPYEDGDPSGWPCLWVDPDTGQPWYVSSREYWD